MDFYLTLSSAAGAIAIFGLAIRHLVFRPHRQASANVDLPAGITVNQIGEIERDLEGLESVIVMADKVERPTDVVSQAVEHNFSRGVKYLFLVSQSRAQTEVSGYYTLFEALAKIVLLRDAGRKRKLSDLIEIKKLPYDWDDYPFIFYRIATKSGGVRTLAFRGDQLHEGLADHYGRVDPAMAHTIAKAVISDGPKEVDLEVLPIDREPYVENQVVQFASYGKSRS